jgi:hypothetical protein
MRFTILLLGFRNPMIGAQSMQGCARTSSGPRAPEIYKLAPLLRDDVCAFEDELSS